MILILALILAGRVESQEPALDLGEQNALNLACDYLRDIIASNGYNMRYCRIREEQSIVGNEAVLKLSVRDNYYPAPVQVDIKLRKSLWNIEDLKIVGLG